jgi:hypothetical protein
MWKRNGSRGMDTARTVVMSANFCLWIYFWAAFAHASYPFRADPLGHPAGTGYTFWGHSIAVVESAFAYPFFKILFWVEFPSFALATITAQAFSPHLLINWFFAGISGGGWLLLGTMALSFFQWYLLAWAAQKIWHRWFGKPKLRN